MEYRHLGRSGLQVSVVGLGCNNFGMRIDQEATQAVVDACNGCDLLIHEVLTHGWLAKRPDFHRYAARFHTTSTQLADLASRAKPRLLVLHHASIAWRPVVDSQRSRPEELLDEMMMHYAGHVVVGRDLDVY